MKKNTILTLKAYAVHGFTSLGIIFAYLAFDAVIKSDFAYAFLWLGVAFVIDGVDGTFARRYDVKKNAPAIDGSALDLVIDYVTYCFIPALMLYHSQWLEESVKSGLIVLLLWVSLYSFSYNKTKTPDGYFSGFPALWNIAVLFFYFLDTPSSVNAGVIIALSVLTFVPMKFVHPFRSKHYRGWLWFFSAVWTVATLVLLSFKSTDNSLVLWYTPLANSVLMLWLLCSLALTLFSLKRSFTTLLRIVD